MTILQLQKETKTPSDDSISIDSDDDLYNSVRTEEAIEWCNRAIGRNPYDSDNYLNKSYFLFVLNRYQEAIDCCDMAISLNPNDEEAYLNKGYILNEYCQVDQALDCYNKAISINPHSYDGYLIKGNLLMDKERYREAMECYQECLKIMPNDLEATKRSEYLIKKMNKSGQLIEPSKKNYIKDTFHRNVTLRIIKKSHYEINKTRFRSYREHLLVNLRKGANYYAAAHRFRQFTTLLSNRKKGKNQMF